MTDVAATASAPAPAPTPPPAAPEFSAEIAAAPQEPAAEAPAPAAPAPTPAAAEAAPAAATETPVDPQALPAPSEQPDPTAELRNGVPYTEEERGQGSQDDGGEDGEQNAESDAQAEQTEPAPPARTVDFVGTINPQGQPRQLEIASIAGPEQMFVAREPSALFELPADNLNEARQEGLEAIATGGLPGLWMTPLELQPVQQTAPVVSASLQPGMTPQEVQTRLTDGLRTDIPGSLPNDAVGPVPQGLLPADPTTPPGLSLADVADRENPQITVLSSGTDQRYLNNKVAVYAVEVTVTDPDTGEVRTAYAVRGRSLESDPAKPEDQQALAGNRAIRDVPIAIVDTPEELERFRAGTADGDRALAAADQVLNAPQNLLQPQPARLPPLPINDAAQGREIANTLLEEHRKEMEVKNFAQRGVDSLRRTIGGYGDDQERNLAESVQRFEELEARRAQLTPEAYAAEAKIITDNMVAEYNRVEQERTNNDRLGDTLGMVGRKAVAGVVATVTGVATFTAITVGTGGVGAPAALVAAFAAGGAAGAATEETIKGFQAAEQRAREQHAERLGMDEARSTALLGARTDSLINQLGDIRLMGEGSSLNENLGLGHQANTGERLAANAMDTGANFLQNGVSGLTGGVGRLATTAHLARASGQTTQALLGSSQIYTQTVASSSLATRVMAGTQGAAYSQAINSGYSLGSTGVSLASQGQLTNGQGGDILLDQLKYEAVSSVLNVGTGGFNEFLPNSAATRGIDMRNLAGVTALNVGTGYGTDSIVNTLDGKGPGLTTEQLLTTAVSSAPHITLDALTDTRRTAADMEAEEARQNPPPEGTVVRTSERDSGEPTRIFIAPPPVDTAQVSPAPVPSGRNPSTAEPDPEAASTTGAEPAADNTDTSVSEPGDVPDQIEGDTEVGESQTQTEEVGSGADEENASPVVDDDDETTPAQTANVERTPGDNVAIANVSKLAVPELIGQSAYDDITPDQRQQAEQIVAERLQPFAGSPRPQLVTEASNLRRDQETMERLVSLTNDTARQDNAEVRPESALPPDVKTDSDVRVVTQTLTREMLDQNRSMQGLSDEVRARVENDIVETVMSRTDGTRPQIVEMLSDSDIVNNAIAATTAPSASDIVAARQAARERAAQVIGEDVAAENPQALAAAERLLAREYLAGPRNDEAIDQATADLTQAFADGRAFAEAELATIIGDDTAASLQPAEREKAIWNLTQEHVARRKVDGGATADLLASAASDPDLPSKVLGRPREEAAEPAAQLPITEDIRQSVEDAYAAENPPNVYYDPDSKRSYTMEADGRRTRLVPVEASGDAFYDPRVNKTFEVDPQTRQLRFVAEGDNRTERTDYLSNVADRQPTGEPAPNNDPWFTKLLTRTPFLPSGPKLPDGTRVQLGRFDSPLSVDGLKLVLVDTYYRARYGSEPRILPPRADSPADIPAPPRAVAMENRLSQGPGKDAGLVEEKLNEGRYLWGFPIVRDIPVVRDIQFPRVMNDVLEAGDRKSVSGFFHQLRVYSTRGGDTDIERRLDLYEKVGQAYAGGLDDQTVRTLASTTDFTALKEDLAQRYTPEQIGAMSDRDLYILEMGRSQIAPLSRSDVRRLSQQATIVELRNSLIKDMGTYAVAWLERGDPDTRAFQTHKVLADSLGSEAQATKPSDDVWHAVVKDIDDGDLGAARARLRERFGDSVDALGDDAIRAAVPRPLGTHLDATRERLAKTMGEEEAAALTDAQLKRHLMDYEGERRFNALTPDEMKQLLKDMSARSDRANASQFLQTNIPDQLIDAIGAQYSPIFFPKFQVYVEITGNPKKRSPAISDDDRFLRGLAPKLIHDPEGNPDKPYVLAEDTLAKFTTQSEFGVQIPGFIAGPLVNPVTNAIAGALTGIPFLGVPLAAIASAAVPIVGASFRRINYLFNTVDEGKIREGRSVVPAGTRLSDKAAAGMQRMTEGGYTVYHSGGKAFEASYPLYRAYNSVFSLDALFSRDPDRKIEDEHPLMRPLARAVPALQGLQIGNPTWWRDSWIGELMPEPNGPDVAVTRVDFPNIITKLGVTSPPIDLGAIGNLVGRAVEWPISLTVELFGMESGPVFKMRPKTDPSNPSRPASEVPDPRPDMTGQLSTVRVTGPQEEGRQVLRTLLESDGRTWDNHNVARDAVYAYFDAAIADARSTGDRRTEQRMIRERMEFDQERTYPGWPITQRQIDQIVRIVGEQTADPAQLQRWANRTNDPDQIRQMRDEKREAMLAAGRSPEAVDHLLDQWQTRRVGGLPTNRAVELYQQLKVDQTASPETLSAIRTYIDDAEPNGYADLRTKLDEARAVFGSLPAARLPDGSYRPLSSHEMSVLKELLDIDNERHHVFDVPFIPAAAENTPLSERDDTSD